MISGVGKMNSKNGIISETKNKENSRLVDYENSNLNRRVMKIRSILMTVKVWFQNNSRN